jgi:hypothetical protein
MSKSFKTVRTTGDTMGVFHQDTRHFVQHLQPLANALWHATHTFNAHGLPVSTRMTVVRLSGGRLLLHSPIPIHAALRTEIEALGTVRYIVAPSKTHHLFAPSCAAAFPQAALYGAPGLRAKRPDLAALQDLPRPEEAAPWRPELEHLQIEGIPAGNETVWFHHPSRTLIVTDLVQWWQGDLPWQARAYASLTGVRQRLAVARTVRLLVRDRQAFQRSTQNMLQWPCSRLVMAHNAVIEADAHAQLSQALAQM